MGLERKELYRSELLSLRHVSCRHANKELSDVEVADANTLILPLRGVFVEHFSRTQQILAEPNSALMIPAGSAARVSHPLSTEDDCLVIEFCNRPKVFPQKAIQVVLSPVATAVRNLMRYRAHNQVCDGLEIEETSVALFDHVLQHSQKIPNQHRRNSKTLRQIDSARLILCSYPERSWKLTVLAGYLNCSPFHLTRMFQRHLGVPLHRYLTYVRLSRSMDLLLDGTDLTTAAMQLGFSSHSHFTAKFRQYIGFAPSRIREAAFSNIAVETRKNLIAAIARLLLN